MTFAFARDILDFWFSLEPRQWWNAGAELDEEIRNRFEEVWHQERSRTPGTLLGNAEDALSGAILFDQFPRNMFRGTAEQYATDPLALAIARGAVDKGLDDGMTSDQRTFLYMPFEHSEDLADQRQSLLLFTALGDPDLLTHARKHYEVIERFGRFPHRNRVLARKPTALETAAGDVVPW
jgi:uncharacterized protein (DUF924 family)